MPVRSCAKKTHIPKPNVQETLVRYWVRNCAKNSYTKTELLFLVLDARVRICTARIYQNSLFFRYIFYEVWSCTNTHIPKQYVTRVFSFIRFGAVQIHIYQNQIPLSQMKMFGSELCKYAYTKTVNAQNRI